MSESKNAVKVVDLAGKGMQRRRNGHVARLPKVLRDLVNMMIRDGFPYGAIIDRLGKPARKWRETCISRWKQGGYLEWLGEQERLEGMGARRRFALEVLREHDGRGLHEANLEVAAGQIYELLSDFEVSTLKEKLSGAPEQYTRIVNALSRLSEEGLKHERYRAEVEERIERIRKELEAGSQKGGLRPETRKRIEHELNLL